MTMIYTIHAPEEKKLASVIEEMRQLGAPRIQVVDCGDYYMALEGSHRIAAAHALGLEPELQVHEQDDILDVSGFDWYEEANWGGTQYEAGEVAGELFSPAAGTYQFSAE